MRRIKDLLAKYMRGVPASSDMAGVYDDRIRESQSNQDAEKFREMRAAREDDSIMEKKREQESLQRKAAMESEKQQYKEEDEKRQSEANIIIKKLEDKEKADRMKKQLQEKGYYQVEEPEIDTLGEKTLNYEDHLKKRKKDLGY